MEMDTDENVSVKQEAVSLSKKEGELDIMNSPMDVSVLLIKEKRSLCREWVKVQNTIDETEYDIIPEESSESSGLNDDEILALNRKNKRKSSGDDLEDSTEKPEKRQRRENISKQVIYHDCEWMGCRFFTTDYVAFQDHVRCHMPELFVKESDTGENVYLCLWDICGFETPCDQEIIRHVNYHCYHTRIKAIGRNVRDRLCLKRCSYDSTQRNQLPPLLSNFRCQWTGCTLNFSSIQDFIDHVKCHIPGLVPNEDGRLACGWLGCRQSCNDINKLNYHSRHHTKERVVACPHCGVLFVTNTKYQDHCDRQIPVIEQDYQCSTCNKLFPTERLMRDHARRHVNSYKCSFCDLTLAEPSALAKHIRYRHLEYKPYKCKICSVRTVTIYDMRAHMFRHEKKRHPPRTESSPRAYACHCCDKVLARVSSLTRHLNRVHGFSLPSGYSRFRYEQSEDGMYRLMPLRYESLEVSNQIVSEEVNKERLSQINNEIHENKEDYKLIQCNPGTSDKPASYVLLPSSQENANLETILAIGNSMTGHDNYSDEFCNISNKKKKKKGKPVQANENKKASNKKPKRKIQPVKAMNSKNKEPQDDILGSKKSLAINEFSCMKRFNGKSPIETKKSIEISIKDVDLHGNIISSKVIKSEEVFL